MPPRSSASASGGLLPSALAASPVEDVTWPHLHAQFFNNHTARDCLELSAHLFCKVRVLSGRAAASVDRYWRVDMHVRCTAVALPALVFTSLSSVIGFETGPRRRHRTGARSTGSDLDYAVTHAPCGSLPA